MKIKRLLAMVMTIAMLASLCAVVNAGSDKVVVANYYDTGDWRNDPNYKSGHEGKYGWKGAVSTKPTVSRAPLDLNKKANWSKVGAVYAKNLDFAVPAQVGGDGANIMDEDGNYVQDTANTWGMSYISAKAVEGAKWSDSDGNHYPKNETPIITYEIKADNGNYITSLDVTAWGCVMCGGRNITFFITPECPTKVTDPELKKLSTFEYLSHFGYATQITTNQNGNYTDADAWKFSDNGKLEYCGLADQKDTVVYLTAMFNVPETGAGAGMTSGTDGKDQIRFMGCKIEAGQAKITAYDPAETEKKEEPKEEETGDNKEENVETGDTFVVSVAALAVVSGAAVVLATRKKKEN